MVGVMVGGSIVGVEVGDRVGKLVTVEVGEGGVVGSGAAI